MKSPSTLSSLRRILALFVSLQFTLLVVLAVVGFSKLAGPLSVLLVLVGIIAGGIFVAQLHKRVNALRSWEVVEPQLQLIDQVPPSNDQIFPLEEVRACDSLSVSWNRLVNDYLSLKSIQTVFEKIDRNGQHRRTGLNSENLLDVLGEGIAVTDIDGRIDLMNDALRTLLDCQSDDDQLLTFTERLEQLSGNQTHLPDSSTLKPSSFEFERDNQGKKQVLKCSRRPRLDEHNQVVGHVWVLKDTTQSRLAEEMREQFVSMASHELRTPLANIRAYAETLALTDGIEVGAQKKFINTIQNEATRLASFIDDLLDVTRMQAGSMTADLHEVDLMRLFREACQKLEGQIEQKKIVFHSKLPEKLPKIRADKHKLAAALVNLVGNAVKYTPDGGEVKLLVENADGNLEIIVEDTGIGIAQEELSRVFEKFFRSDDDRVREITGSGLGLSFTREVARLHGGEIQVHSELNKGTRFTMTLPIGREALA